MCADKLKYLEPSIGYTDFYRSLGLQVHLKVRASLSYNHLDEIGFCGVISCSLAEVPVSNCPVMPKRDWHKFPLAEPAKFCFWIVAA